MIYGIEASDYLNVAPGYAPAAVHFSGYNGANGQCAISRSSLSCTNNGFLAWAGWFKTTWYTGQLSGAVPWIVDSASLGRPVFILDAFHQYWFEVGNGTRSWGGSIGATTSEAFLDDNTWQHIIAACDTNHASGAKFFKIYVDGVDSTANITETNPAWTFLMNGKDFIIGDNGSGTGWFGDVADFSFWPGVNFFTAGDISSTTRELFRTAGGAPVDPSVAIAALGTPAIMCAGGVSGFLANTLGGSGALTVPGGYDSPTAAATHP